MNCPKCNDDIMSMSVHYCNSKPERTMNTPTPRTDEWETYCDEWYYHMWRLRRKTERGWHDGFHIQKGDEAKGLCDILNNLEAELTAVTEQRDRLAEILRNCMPFILDDGCLYRDARETLQSLTTNEL